MALTSKALGLSESFSMEAETSWNGRRPFFSVAELFFHIILLASHPPSTSDKAASTSLLSACYFTAGRRFLQLLCGLFSTVGR